jgi:hypothetical protein
MDSDLGTAFKDMLKPYRFTLQMPACVTICTTGWVEPRGQRLQHAISAHAKPLRDRGCKMRNSSSTCTLTTPSMTRPARFRSRSSVRLASRCSRRPMAHPCRWRHTTIRPASCRALAAASPAFERALILSPSSFATMTMIRTVSRLAFGMSAATKSTQRRHRSRVAG